MMKKYYFVAILVVVCLCISVFVIKEMSLANSVDERIFSIDDTKILGIKIDMQKEEVEKILGQPKKVESNYEGAFGYVLTYYYEFGNICFEPIDIDKYAVSDIIIDKPKFIGPRGIRVNDKVETVLQKFPYNKNSSINTNREKYVYGELGVNCGFITYDKKGNIASVIYRFGGGGFGTYTLWMEVNKNLIKSIKINVMNV